MGSYMMASSYTRAINKEISKSIGYILDLPFQKLVFLSTVDFLFTQTVINTFSTASWRGVWNLFDLLLVEEGAVWQNAPYTDCLVTCPLAIALNVCVYLVAPFVQEWTQRLGKPARFLITRSFTVFYFIVYMLLWRSFWNLFLLCFTTERDLGLTFLGSSLFLMSVRCFNSVVGNPTSVALDNTKDYCSISTLFSEIDVNTLKKWQLKLLPLIDSVCTVTIEILNILLWYAVDEVLLMILPAYPQVSKLSQCLHPLAFGLLTGTLAFYGQMVIVCFVDGRTGEGLRPLSGISWRRKITDWLLSGMGMLSSVLHWYGLWTLLDYFFLPNLPKLSNIITAIFGILGMCLTGCSRSLHGGLARDGYLDDPYPIQPYFFLSFINWS